jgi:hypothetical protein
VLDGEGEQCHTITIVEEEGGSGPEQDDSKLTVCLFIYALNDIIKI